MDFSEVSHSLSKVIYVQIFGLILSHKQSVTEGFYSRFKLRATLLKCFLIVQKPVKLQLVVKELCIYYTQ